MCYGLLDMLNEFDDYMIVLVVNDTYRASAHEIIVRSRALDIERLQRLQKQTAEVSPTKTHTENQTTEASLSPNNTLLQNETVEASPHNHHLGNQTMEISLSNTTLG